MRADGSVSVVALGGNALVHDDGANVTRIVDR